MKIQAQTQREGQEGSNLSCFASTGVLLFVGIVILSISLGCGAVIFSFFCTVIGMSTMHALAATIFVWMISMLCIVMVLAAWILCGPFSELMYTTAK